MKTYHLDAYTINTFKKLKRSDEILMSEDQVKEHKKATVADVAELLA